MLYRLCYKLHKDFPDTEVVEEMVEAVGFHAENSGIVLWRYGAFGGQENIAFYSEDHFIRIVEVDAQRKP